MTDIQAAIGLVQLSRTDELLGNRRRVAEVYTPHLERHPLLKPPFVPVGLEPNWQSYQVTTRDAGVLTRNEIMERLFKAGVPTRRGVMASHLELPYCGIGVSLPHTECVAANSLQLPIHSALTENEVGRVIAAIDGLVQH